MTPFTQHAGVAMPLRRSNIDTDTIIPSREMRTVSRSGLAAGLFAPWRYSDPTCVAEPSFVFNQPAYRDASILLAGEKLWLARSAVWALQESVSRNCPPFATIFRNNAQQWLLTVDQLTVRSTP